MTNSEATAPASWLTEMLQCPLTQAHLVARRDVAGTCAAVPSAAQPIGPTEVVLVTDDSDHAYPVVDGIPVLMGPERLSRHPHAEPVLDVHAPPYEECYQERALYSDLALEHTADRRQLARMQAMIARTAGLTFPTPPEMWHHGGSGASAYALAMQHLAPIEGATLLQIGGIGTHAITMVHAGADRAVVVSPVMQELKQGVELASALGVQDRVAFVCGIAEELPLKSATFDRVYSGSSIHHTVTTHSFPEAARVLRTNGRFASLDVWRNGLLYDVGIKVFGKRHGNAYCVALDGARLEPAGGAFDQVETSFHGAIARYPLAIAERLGTRLSPKTSQRIGSWEDRVSARIPAVSSRTASLVLVRATVNASSPPP